MNALEVEHLSHDFGGRHALADVSFAVPPGAFTVLLGLNGAGKTTLMSLVTGLYHARHGSIRVFGHALRDAPTAALAAMGIVFQQPTLDLDLTVAENLRYAASLQGLSRQDAVARADDELARVDLADRARDRVRALSGGLRRRVELARALLHAPRLLLLDEPTVGLDAATRRVVLAHARAIGRERGVAVLWATHLLDEVEPADGVVVLHRGTVRWTGPASALGGADSLHEAFMRLVGDAA